MPRTAGSAYNPNLLLSGSRGATYSAVHYQHAFAAAMERYAYTASMTKQALDVYAAQKQQLRVWMEDYDPQS